MEALRELNARGLPHALDIELHDQILLALYYFILEHCQAALLLAKADHFKPAIPILRVSLEAWVELELIKKNPQQQCIRRQVRDTEKAEKTTKMAFSNPYFEDVPKERLIAISRGLSDLKKRSSEVAKPDIKASFQKAGLEHHYAVYDLFSKHVHPTNEMLVREYLPIAAQKLGCTIASHHPEIVLGGIQFLLENCSTTVHVYFETGQATEIEQLFA